MVKHPQHSLALLESHPQWPLAIKIYEKLKAEGFETYLAGGCVRDLVLNIKPKDIDIATAAPPEKVLSFFPKTLEVGQAFGVVRVVEDSQVIEVATFRKDGAYKDGRRPEEVIYSDPKHDAERRDFTVNALFLDVAKKEIIDYIGGLTDIQRQVIKTVGAAELRFEEDHLRLLRAVRFSAQLGFQIERRTWEAMKSHAGLLAYVSEERIRDEIYKLLSSAHVLNGLVQLHESSMLKMLSPELYKSADAQFMDWMKLAGGGIKPEMIWAFFFWPLIRDSDNWDSFLNLTEKFKLTRDEKKSLKFSFDFIKKGRTWTKIGLGEKLIFFASQEGPSLLQMQACLDIAWQADYQNLRSYFSKVAPDGRLPAPFLSGEDVMHLDGKARGDKLYEIYVQQLEGKIKNREEALKLL
jgi:tRNA nucleotidyltransferase/poly(A) polymerase